MGSRITGAVILSALTAAACNTTNGGLSDYYESPPVTVAPTPGPQPNFTTQAVSLDAAPPPISGGTLTIAPDGHTVVASDPDRDRIYVVDIPSRTVKYDVPLGAGAEPGRVAIDSHNVAHVALRGTGHLLSLNLLTGAKTDRPVCLAPRGVVYDAKVDSIHVACSEGILATLSLRNNELKTLGLDRDIRDLVVSKDRLFVSHFRSAQVSIISREGEIVGSSSTQGGNLGWRMTKGPATEGSDDGDSDDVALVSQDPQNPAPTPGGVGYYGSGAIDECNSPTITTTRLDIPGQAPVLIPPAVLPVDLATNGKGEYAIVAAGNAHTKELPQIYIHRVKPLGTAPTDPSSSSGGFGFGTNPDCLALGRGYVPGQAIAAGYDADNQLIVQSREPAALYIMSPDRKSVFKEIKLSDESKEDSGHAIFHSNSGGSLACASCHAEGGEDGRTWEFVEGQRRTPSMRGTLVGTAPYHWAGDMKDLSAIMDGIFSVRMSGPKVDKPHVDTLEKWLFKLPAPPRLNKPEDAVNRGKQVFEARGCNTCHSGATLTNNTTLDVGNGGAFQVPSLVGVSWRAPYLHNGCAKTLKDRLDGSTACGDKHGNIDGLTKPEINDLTTYLESL